MRKSWAAALVAAFLAVFVFGFGISHVSAQPATSHVLWSNFGEAAYNHDGNAVAAAGDLNGDGNADVLVAAPTYQPFDQFGIAGRGKVYLYDGPTGNLIWSQAGFGASDEFGRGLAGGVDLNADGVPDILIGAPGESSYSGRVYVYSGINLALSYSIVGDSLNDQLGKSVAFTGDLDGDGKADFFAGAPGYSAAAGNGRAYARSGGNFGQTIYFKDAPVAAIQLGFDVGDAGDVDQDGKNDMIVGGPKTDLGGHAYVFSSAGPNYSQLFGWHGESQGSEFGHAVDGCGDVNGDGFPDLIVGSPFYAIPNGKGKAYVYSGSNGSLIKSYLGPQNSANMGQTVAYCGDVNRDGRPDIFFGAESEGFGYGAAYIYSGVSPSTLIRKWSCGPPNPYFSFSLGISRAGDLNGDGLQDVMVGAEDSLSGPATAAGAVFALRVLPDMSEPNPGLANQLNIFTVSGATPGATVKLYRSLIDGRTPITGCPGLHLDMEFPELMGSLVVQPDGTASSFFFIPASYSWRTAYFQCAEEASCTASDRDRFSFP